MVRKCYTSTIAVGFLIGMVSTAIAANAGSLATCAPMGLTSSRVVETGCPIDQQLKGKTSFREDMALVMVTKKPKKNYARAPERRCTPGDIRRRSAVAAGIFPS